MPEYLHPGVYIEEIERGPKPIEGVPTSTAVLLIVNTYLNGGDYRPILAKIDKPLLYVAEPAMGGQARMVRERLPSARVGMLPSPIMVPPPQGMTT